MQLCTKNFYSRPLQKCFTTPLGLNPQVENNWLRPNQRILQPSATILKNLPISTDDLFWTEAHHAFKFFWSPSRTAWNANARMISARSACSDHVIVVMISCRPMEFFVFSLTGSFLTWRPVRSKVEKVIVADFASKHASAKKAKQEPGLHASDACKSFVAACVFGRGAMPFRIAWLSLHQSSLHTCIAKKVYQRLPE